MMTTVFQQLQQARKQHALVNLYQASQEIIYTLSLHDIYVQCT